MRIGLVPLDERPANVRYPAMIAAIFGVDLVVPPAEAIGATRDITTGLPLGLATSLPTSTP